MTRTTAISGLGVVSAFGPGTAVLRAGLFSGRTALRPLTRVPADRLGRYGGEVPGLSPDQTAAEWVLALATTAGLEALEDAGLRSARGRIGLVVGVSLVAPDRHPALLAERIGRALDVGGPRLAVTTACSASAGAIVLARDLLWRGDVDCVLAGGVDVVTQDVVFGFAALGLLSPAACRPFGDTLGTTLADGAAFLVLERPTAALARGKQPRAWLRGAGLSNDAFHESSPDPRGEGLRLAIDAALRDAGLAPEAIDAVNAHGTGTAHNDAAEAQALRTVFGDRAVPVSACKPIVGHAQSAAGALELVCSILGLESQALPRCNDPGRRRRDGPLGLVVGSEARSAPHRRVLSHNAAFGGANAALIVSTERPHIETTERRRVYVAGTGLAVADVGESTTLTGAHAPEDASALEHEFPRVDARRATPQTRFLTLAVARALRDAGRVVQGEDDSRCGLVTAVTSISTSAWVRYSESVQRRGLGRLDVTAVPHLVPGAGPGGTARRLGLRGPFAAITALRAGGLAALSASTSVVAWNYDAVDMIAAAVDEREGADPVPFHEGAAALMLTSRQTAVEVSGTSVAGDLESCIALALSDANRSLAGLDLLISDLSAERLRVVVGDAVSVLSLPQWRCAALSLSSMVCAVSATDRLGADVRLRAILVVTEEPGLAASATVLTRVRS